DVGSGASTLLFGTGDAVPAMVSKDLSHIYFVSLSKLDSSGGTAGEPNLYVFDGGTIKFIATVEPTELTGGSGPANEAGLTRWSANAGWSSGAVAQGMDDPISLLSRTTPDGSVFVFQTAARATAYDNNGQSEVYRYDADTGTLECVSCSPSGAPAQAGA